MKNTETDGAAIEALRELPNPMGDFPGAMDAIGAGVANLIARVKGTIGKLAEWWDENTGW